MNQTGDSDDQLTEDPQTDLLVLALARGMTQKRAAAESGVSRSTVVRRLQDAAFQERVANARRDILTRATSQIADSLALAIRTLRAILKSKSEQNQLGAAKSLLALALPLNEQLNLNERLEVLERRVSENSPRRPRRVVGRPSGL